MLSRMLGVDPNVEITPVDFWKLIHPDDAPRAREAIERSTRERSGVVIEFRLLAADGSERWIRSYATPRPLASVQPRGTASRST
jgi:PAS domain S-box-containing protein